MLRAADIRNQLQRHVRYLTHLMLQLSLSFHTSHSTLLKYLTHVILDPFPPFSHCCGCDGGTAALAYHASVLIQLQIMLR